AEKRGVGSIARLLQRSRATTDTRVSLVAVAGHRPIHGRLRRLLPRSVRSPRLPSSESSPPLRNGQEPWRVSTRLPPYHLAHEPGGSALTSGSEDPLRGPPCDCQDSQGPEGREESNALRLMEVLPIEDGLANQNADVPRGEGIDGAAADSLGAPR